LRARGPDPRTSAQHAGARRHDPQRVCASQALRCSSAAGRAAPAQAEALGVLDAAARRNRAGTDLVTAQTRSRAHEDVHREPTATIYRAQARGIAAPRAREPLS
jgi:hypothetical protein